MVVTSTKELLFDASKNGYAIGAFNVTNMVQLRAVLGLPRTKCLRSSFKTRLLLRSSMVRKCGSGYSRPWLTRSKCRAALHFYHCTEVDYCIRCVNAGYSSVMIDASKLVFKENVDQTRLVCEYAHRKDGITVEGELGTVAGVEDQIKVVENESALCDPDEVLNFVELTDVDFLAPAIGTAHGIYLTKDPKIDFMRFAKINKIINGAAVRVPLVIHGGTGLPENIVRTLVSSGGSKLNVSTELKHTLLDAEYEYISTIEMSMILENSISIL